MIEAKQSGFLRGMSDIFRRYVISRAYVCFMMIPILFLTIAANFLYSNLSLLVSEIGEQINSKNFSESKKLAYKFFTYGVLATVFEYLPIFAVSWIVQDIYRDCYRDVFQEYISLEYSTFYSITPGDMENKINRKCMAIGEAIDVVVPALINSIIFVAIALIRVHQSFGISMSLLFLVIPFLYISITIFFAVRRNKIRGKYNKAIDRSLKKLNDVLYNYEVVKTYGLEEKEMLMFRSTLDENVTTGTAYHRSENIMVFLQRLSAVIPHVVILYITLNKRNLTLAGAIELNGLHSVLKERLSELAREFSNLCEHYFDYSTSTFGTEQDLPVKSEINGFENEIVVSNVGIRREKREVLKNIGFILKKGQKLAIAGPNGAGKSTLMNAMLRFLNYSGEIFIDDAEIKECTRKSIRRLISYVPQDNCVIDDTVLKNLKYGREDASFEYVKEVCKKYGTHEIFDGLEGGGYLKYAGQQGCELSGGQRQYLSLMRAVIKDSPIFILDEATSSVDYKIEKELIDYIMTALPDKTIIMIVHSHALFRKFDRVLFLKDGSMKGYGTVDELLKSSVDFAKFYQFDAQDTM